MVIIQLSSTSYNLSNTSSCSEYEKLIILGNIAQIVFYFIIAVTVMELCLLV